MRTLVSLLALGALTACGRRAHDSPDAFRWEAELEPGTTIHLRTGSGRIDVTPATGSSNNQAHIGHFQPSNPFQDLLLAV